jgi:predicted dehydrogenase
VTYRAAVIGCGNIGSGFADDPRLAADVYTHAEAYVRSEATELVAVCDRDAEVATGCAKRWSIEASFTDTADLLVEAQPEIVSICTPDETHFDIARQALEASSVRAILCEKPLATSIEQGEELARLAREGGTIMAVAYVRRYADNMQALRRFLQDGSIGPVQAVTGWYGKGTLHNGSHWFDLLRMLAGEIEWVEAADWLGDEGTDPSLDVTLGLASGAVATLRAVDHKAFTIFEMDLIAESGRVSVRNSGHAIGLYRPQPSERYWGYSELAPEAHDVGDMRNTMLHAVDDLAGALSEGRPPLCTAEDGLAALRIAIAARKSAADNGCRVRLQA